MDAMGEKITIQVMGMKEPEEKKVERVRFVTIGVMWYAHSKKMTFADAYKSLHSSRKRMTWRTSYCLRDGKLVKEEI